MEHPTNLDEESEKYLTLMAMTIARAWKDSSFKARLIAHPESVIKEEGLTFPPGVGFIVHENTKKVRYLPIKRHINLETDMNEIKYVLSHVLPIPIGNEIRLVQSTESVRYLVLPVPPANIDIDSASQKDLFAHAIAEGTTSTVTDVATVQTGVTVTTGVTTAEAAVDVVAVAVAVAT